MTTTITFPRPTRALLNLNDRHHWARKASDVKAWRMATFAAVFAAKLAFKPQPPSMVCITVDVPDKRRRDPANVWVQKPIIDELVHAGWWPDDTPEWVTVVEPVLRVVRSSNGYHGARQSPPLMVTVELRPR